MTDLARAVVLVAPLLASAGCAKLHASAQPNSVPLETPVPPPRVIVPVESEPIAPAVPPVEAPGRRPTVDAPRAVTPPVTTPPATTSPRVERTDPPPLPSANPPSDDPARTLQTTANAGETEQRIRTLISNAARDLGRIDYRALSANAQAQYDIARRFREQAEEALKARNLVFAEQLADKAAALAGQLLKR